MVATILLNGTMGFASILTYCFVIQDVESQIINSAFPFAYIGVFEAGVRPIPSMSKKRTGR